MLKNAISDEEIMNCFDVMVELRPHLQRNDFLQTVRQMEADGYKLAFIAKDDAVVAVSGYRIYSNLFMGKHLYVDDLVTATRARSEGHGRRMVEWLREQAVQEGCNYIHLDSGTQRGEAHKFYFNQGFTIASYHFSEPLKVSEQAQTSNERLNSTDD